MTIIEEPKTTIEAPKFGTVPIMLEITEEDRQNARPYTDCQNCLVGTALRRMGYDNFEVTPFDVCFYKDNNLGGEGQNPEHYFMSDDIGCDELQYIFGAHPVGPFYKKGVTGKQIMLYPCQKSDIIPHRAQIGRRGRMSMVLPNAVV